MIVVGQDVLCAAAQVHRSRGLDKALAAWAKVAEEALWRHFPDVRQTWPSADYVAGYVVFNIKGGHFRLAARINYRIGVVTVVEVMTHAEYDQWSARLR
jgi:mRNA interferase HigB